MTTFVAKIGEAHGHRVYACHDYSSVWVRVEVDENASGDFAPQYARDLGLLLAKAAEAAEGVRSATPLRGRER